MLLCCWMSVDAVGNKCSMPGAWSRPHLRLPLAPAFINWPRAARHSAHTLLLPLPQLQLRRHV